MSVEAWADLVGALLICLAMLFVVWRLSVRGDGKLQPPALQAPRIKLLMRRGTARQAHAANEVLAAGELAYETDTGRFKFGDGKTPWNQLPYAAGAQGYATHDAEGGAS